MNSALYTGEVEHQRLAPTAHRFVYPIYFYAFDLAELPTLDRELPGFGYNRVRPVALHDRDYLDPAPAPIAAKLQAHLAAVGGAAPAARVLLVTAARCWNYVFNPVSFYFGLADDGRPLWAVAEVNNTFGDRHLYLLPSLAPGDEPGTYTATAAKAMHVSPFNDMTGGYAFRFRCTPEEIDIRVDLRRDGVPVLLASLRGRGRPLTARALWVNVLRRPLAVALNVPRIAFQAARLRFSRGLPVYTRPEPESPLTIVRRPPGLLERWARDRVLGYLARIRHGDLTVTLPDGSVHRFGAAGSQPAAALHVRRYRAFTRILLGGDVGFGEAYVAEDFSCDDPAAVVALLILNRAELADGSLAHALAARLANAWRHRLRPNTRVLSRRNIREHYDLGNDFYALFLDRSMLYSCARFDQPGATLEEAQQRKLHTLIDKARIRPEHHVLEIGCGWGAFAIEAARRTGCRVTAITVSPAQLQLATERVRAAGLADRVEVRLCDYRDLRGRFDRIVSIEMIEAVGHRFLKTYFRACDRLLAPNGLVVLQALTIPDFRYEAYRRGCDWIQKHIFPGGHLPSLAAMQAALARASELHVEALENIGPHYAATLQLWRARFDQQEARVRALGFDAAFVRKWRYYFAYCEAAFGTRTLNALQLVLSRPNNRDLDPPPMPDSLRRTIPARDAACR